MTESSTTKSVSFGKVVYIWWIVAVGIVTAIIDYLFASVISAEFEKHEWLAFSVTVVLAIVVTYIGFRIIKYLKVQFTNED